MANPLDEQIAREHREMQAALRLALPVLEREFGDYGPNEPERRALDAVRAALKR